MERGLCFYKLSVEAEAAVGFRSSTMLSRSGGADTETYIERSRCRSRQLVEKLVFVVEGRRVNIVVYSYRTVSSERR